MKSNCISCAIRLYFRMRKRWKLKGSPEGFEPYLLLRSSRLNPKWMPHVLVGIKNNNNELLLISYKPIDTTDLPWWEWWKALRFNGKIVRGD